jgi:hypothetical protein
MSSVVGILTLGEVFAEPSPKDEVIPRSLAMHSAKLALALSVLSAALFGLGAEAHAQSKSQTLTISAPSSARVNTDVTVTMTASDTWNGQRLVARPIQTAVGEEFYLSNRGTYYTSNQGVASFRTRFTSTGRYRIVVFIDNGFGYLSQRSTAFITITR